MILSYVSDPNVFFLIKLFNALYCALVTGLVSEICLRKVWNYDKGVTEKMTFKLYFQLNGNILYSSVSQKNQLG